MNKTREKQVHLSYLGITAVVLYNAESPLLCRIGLAVMSPMDRMAQQLIDPAGADPWSARRGTAIARGRAQEMLRRRTALRGMLTEAQVENVLVVLLVQDEFLKHLLSTVAKQNPSEQLFARMAGTVRALHFVRVSGISVGRTWDRRITLAFGAGVSPTAVQSHKTAVHVGV